MRPLLLSRHFLSFSITVDTHIKNKIKNTLQTSTMAEESIIIFEAATTGTVDILAGVQFENRARGRWHYDNFKERCRTLVDGRGRTPLHVAAFYGHHRICSYFIRAIEVPVDIQTVSGETALLIAARENRLATARLLIGLNADTTSSDSKGLTSLHFAAMHGNRELIRLLLMRGADIEANSIYGTPAVYAAALGQYDVVRFLIDNGAEIQNLSLAHYTYALAKGKEAAQQHDYLNAQGWYTEAFHVYPINESILHMAMVDFVRNARR